MPSTNHPVCARRSIPTSKTRQRQVRAAANFGTLSHGLCPRSNVARHLPGRSSFLVENSILLGCPHSLKQPQGYNQLTTHDAAQNTINPRAVDWEAEEPDDEAEDGEFEENEDDEQHYSEEEEDGLQDIYDTDDWQPKPQERPLSAAAAGPEDQARLVAALQTFKLPDGVADLLLQSGVVEPISDASDRELETRLKGLLSAVDPHQLPQRVRELSFMLNCSAADACRAMLKCPALASVPEDQLQQRFEGLLGLLQLPPDQVAELCCSNGALLAVPTHPLREKLKGLKLATGVSFKEACNMVTLYMFTF